MREATGREAGKAIRVIAMLALGSFTISASAFETPGQLHQPARDIQAGDRQHLQFHRLPLNGTLTQNTVPDMLQDRRGLMWFATLGGLDVYDGYEFRTVSSDPRQDNSLSGVHVSRLHEDSHGNIWVAGFSGWLNRIVPDSQRIDSYSPELYGGPDRTIPGPTAFHETPDGDLIIGTVTGLHGYDRSANRFVRGIDQLHDEEGVGVVTAMEPAGNGRIWVGSNNGLLLYDLEAGIVERHVADTAEPTSLPAGAISALLRDSRDRLWIGTAAAGLARLEPGSGDFKVFRADPGEPASIGSNLVTDIMEDSAGTVWIAHQSGGLSRYRESSADFIVHRHDPDDPDTLANNDVWSLFEDRTGLVWIGTAGSGLNQLNPSRNRFNTLHSIPFNENSLQNPFVWDIAETADGRIWMATLAGLESYDPDAHRFAFHRPSEASGGASVGASQMQSVAVGPLGKVWVGSVDGRLYSFDPASESFRFLEREGAPPGKFDVNRIWGLFPDDEGRLWVSCVTGIYVIDVSTMELVHTLPASESLPLGGSPVRAILPAGDGYQWLGAGGGGLTLYHPEQGIVRQFDHERDNPQSLSHPVIRAILPDGDGGLWLGTMNGLNHITAADLAAGRNRFTLYTTEEGLPNNTVYGLLPGEAGAIWLSTNAGLSRFEPATGKVENFDTADGLPSNEMNGGAELRSRDGRLYFGGVGGVTIISPGELPRNTVAPEVAITGVSIRGERQPLADALTGEPLEISHSANDLGVEFAVMDFHQPEKNRFRYRLLGASPEWREIAQRRIDLTRLASGSYRLEILGSNNDGLWSERPAVLSFHVAPPPWQSPLAYAAYALLFVLLLLGYHLAQRRRLARERQFNEELSRAHSLAEANHQMALRYAQNDVLTQLPNRSSLLDAMARYMRFARSRHKRLAVVVVNLDRFQQVNDSFGHAIGDRVLKSIAARLEEFIGENDFLARIGADEFAWLAVLEKGESLQEWIAPRARELLAVIGEPFDFQDPPVVLQASIGCAAYEGGAESTTDLLGYADVALHAAKSEEETTLRCYEPAMTESARQRISIEARMKRALATDEFSAHFQPLLAIPGGELKGVEALIRWFPEGADPVFPDQFIPIAEQSGLIVDVGNWMIHRVCRQLAEWRPLLPDGFQAAINVSMRQLRSGTLVPTLRNALQETGIQPALLKVEITESAMMENVEDTAEQLQEVRRLGVEISVDDFGTGFSSLSHLKMLPVHELKIDRSFVMDISSSAESRSIVESIVRLAHELKLRVVAEGVEDEAALSLLHEIGCDVAQGYYFSRPLPAAELVAGGWFDLQRERA